MALQNPNKIEVESITLDRSSAKVVAKGELSLLATVLPENATDKTITWESSDKTKVSVENGKITGLETTAKDEIVTITAKAGGKTATCAVTVVTPVELAFPPAQDLGFDEIQDCFIQNDVENYAINYSKTQGKLAIIPKNITAESDATIYVEGTFQDGSTTYILAMVTYRIAQDGSIKETYPGKTKQYKITQAKKTKNAPQTVASVFPPLDLGLSCFSGIKEALIKGMRPFNQCFLHFCISFQEQQK